MSDAILSVNSGSSSIKFGLFRITGDGLLRVAGGKLENIGIAPTLSISDEHGAPVDGKEWPDGTKLTHEDLLQDLFEWAPDHLPREHVVAVGHRVVHGGEDFVAPVMVDGAVLDRLEKLCALAPLHQPHNLSAIRALAELAPELPQVACFDTAFHATMAPVTARMPLPRSLRERGIRRYGFHGLSYEYVAQRLRLLDPELASGRVVTAHLGNGASMCAMADGYSMDTTMGFTALDGLVMGTRTGALDPGVILHLIRQMGMSPAAVESMLYRDSGLQGLSGVSSDMRTLHASTEPAAAEAIESFTWAAARQLTALCVSLGGLDGIVFTAGIGENDPVIRSLIAARLGWLGIELDEVANQANADVISTPGSRMRVRVIPTDEEAMIARHAFACTGGAR